MGDRDPQQSQVSLPKVALDYKKVLNPFGFIHAVQLVLAVLVIICVTSTDNSYIYLHEFGYILFIAILAALYAIIWAIIMLLNNWPSGSRNAQIGRLACGFIISQLYLTAFACSCSMAYEFGVRRGEGPSFRRVQSGFGAAAFFTVLAWLVHLGDTFLSWYYFGGIYPQDGGKSSYFHAKPAKTTTTTVFGSAGGGSFVPPTPSPPPAPPITYIGSSV